jgi:hypothetical protein
MMGKRSGAQPVLKHDGALRSGGVGLEGAHKPDGIEKGRSGAEKKRDNRAVRA